VERQLALKVVLELGQAARRGRHALRPFRDNCLLEPGQAARPVRALVLAQQVPAARVLAQQVLAARVLAARVLAAATLAEQVPAARVVQRVYRRQRRSPLHPGFLPRRMYKT